MNLKIGKHISTATAVLGLLVLTSAVAHADAYTAQKLENCIKQRMYRCVVGRVVVSSRYYCAGEWEQVMGEQVALEICKEAFRSRETWQRRQRY